MNMLSVRSVLIPCRLPCACTQSSLLAYGQPKDPVCLSAFVCCVLFTSKPNVAAGGFTWPLSAYPKEDRELLNRQCFI